MEVINNLFKKKENYYVHALVLENVYFKLPWENPDALP
jgi:hypothetical protein